MSRILESYLVNEAAIKRLLYRYKKNPEDIDDMAQETFLRAFAAEKGGEIVSPKAFLFRTARNIAINSVTNKTARSTRYVGDSDVLYVLCNEREGGEDEQLDICQKLEILSGAISTLPPVCRRVFLLRKVDGYTHKEIAARFGISAKTVENHLANGAIKCNKYLRDLGYNPVNSSISKRNAYDEARISNNRGVGKRAYTFNG